MVLSSIYESLWKYMGEYHFLNPSISTILLNDCDWESLGHAVNHYRLIKPTILLIKVLVVYLFRFILSVVGDHGWRKWTKRYQPVPVNFFTCYITIFAKVMDSMALQPMCLLLCYFNFSIHLILCLKVRCNSGWKSQTGSSMWFLKSITNKEI